MGWRSKLHMGGQAIHILLGPNVKTRKYLPGTAVIFFIKTKKSPILLLSFLPVTYNGRMRSFVIVDGKGITTWNKDAVSQQGGCVHRSLAVSGGRFAEICHFN